MKGVTWIGFETITTKDVPLTIWSLGVSSKTVAFGWMVVPVMLEVWLRGV